VSVDESSPGASRLAVPLKEVLQQIPDEDAKALMDAYVSGLVHPGRALERSLEKPNAAPGRLSHSDRRARSV